MLRFPFHTRRGSAACEYQLLFPRLFKHRAPERVLVDHLKLQGGARFVEHKKIGGLAQGGEQKLLLLSARFGLLLLGHLKDKFLPRLAPEDRRAELLEQRDLPALRSFEELNDHHAFSGGESAQRHAHGGGRLALAVAPI